MPQTFSFFIKGGAIAAAFLFLSSAACAQASPVAPQPDIAVQEYLNKYPGLLAAFGELVEKLEHEVQFPAARSESRLLPLLPESTMSYVAISNYGDTANQILKVFRQELQENPALRDWWQHGEMAASGPKVEDALDQIYQLNQYLGEEIVISGALEARDPKFLAIAEVRKPGLKKFLQQLVNHFDEKSQSPVRVLDVQELASAHDKMPPAQDLIVLVRPDLVIAALDLATLRKFNAQLDHHNREFASAPFGRRISKAYAGGTTFAAAADLHKIVTENPLGASETEMFQRSGFADVQYAVWAHKTVAGQAVSQSELSFISPRHGIAAWLAKPGPLGSLDFVSPDAMLAVSMVLKNPAQIFDDVRDLSNASNPNAFAAIAQFEKVLNLSLKQDLLSHLSGEIALELDNRNATSPAWRAILRVNEPDRLQQTFSTLLAAANLTPQKFDEGGVRYNTFRIAANKPEIAYAFADGYLIVASTRDSVADAIHMHNSGGSLGKSKKFLAALPAGHSAEASALLYEDPIAMTTLRIRQMMPQMADALSQAARQTSPIVVGVYGEESAIREASNNSSFDAAGVLIVAAIAIPNLIKSKMAANEASAVGSIRVVNSAQVTYSVTYPQKGYAPNLSVLGPDPRSPNKYSPDHAGLLDEPLGNSSCIADAWCTKSGYHFRVTAVCHQHVCKEFVALATPVSSNSGNRSFCSTSDGIIRFKPGPPLSAPVSVKECRAWLPLN